MFATPGRIGRRAVCPAVAPERERAFGDAVALALQLVAFFGIAERVRQVPGDSVSEEPRPRLLLQRTAQPLQLLDAVGAVGERRGDFFAVALACEEGLGQFSE